MPHERLRPHFAFTDERLADLKDVVPEAFADGMVNWDALREALGDWLEEEGSDAEHFGLTWPGKRSARRLAGIPSRGTLVPLPGEGVNEAATANIFIEGDNLEVLKLLQKSYGGAIQMIYVDPPYNTGKDFVYRDDFVDPLRDYLRKSGQVDEEGTPLTTNTRAEGRFHSNWLSMMYPRLRLARGLLKQDGAIFVSIDDNEMHTLRTILGEIFGEENFVACVVWQRSKKGDSKLIALTHEYILVFARDRAALVAGGGWRRKKAGVDEVLSKYAALRNECGKNHSEVRKKMQAWYKALAKGDPSKAHAHYNWSDDRGLYFASDFAGPDDGRKNRPRYDILHPVTGKPCAKPSTGWRWDEKRAEAALSENPPRIHFGRDHTTIPCRKSYLTEVDTEAFSSVFYADGRSATLDVEGLIGAGVFPFPKNAEILADLIALACPREGLVLDFFAGSGSTAQAVMQQSRADGIARRHISIQLPEPTEDASKAKAAGFSTVADIWKKRVLQAGVRLTSEAQPEAHEDLGYKVLALKPSYFRAWQDYVGTEDTELQLAFDEAENPLVNGWTPDGLLTEVMLLEGFPLDSNLSAAKTSENSNIRLVTSPHCGHRLFACFDKVIKGATVDTMDLKTEDVFICLDTALTDQGKLRLSDRCILKTI